VEELADFLQRDVEDVRQKWAAEVQAEVQRSATRVERSAFARWPNCPPSVPCGRGSFPG
jgi:hypothetical protein